MGIRILMVFAVLALSLCVSIAPDVQAERATQVEMDRVCQNWLSYMVYQRGAWGGETRPKITQVDEIVQGDTVLARCFSIAPRGYVVVPILKELPPIKAYSEKDGLEVDQTNGFPQLLREVLLHRIRLYVKTYGSLDAVQPPTGDVLLGREHKAEWREFLTSQQEFRTGLKQGELPALRGAGPLLRTSWHQNAPYNSLCPMGDLARQCLVGCVATAAAQIMKYWNWPPSGTGSHTYWWDGDQSCGGNVGGGWLSADFSDPYDWQQMPDSCDFGCPAQDSAALAELCYEVGVAFEMDYGVCSSGANTADALLVYPTYFLYDNSIDREDRDQHSAQTWFDLIKTEVNQSRPMQYKIIGHSIVCDGWRDTGYAHHYHINYGWGGSHTTWFAIDNIYGSEDPMEEYLVRNIMPQAVALSCEDINPVLPILQLDSWSWTYYDEQQKGSMGRMIAASPGGHRHMVCSETQGPYGTAYPRYVTYNCKNPLDQWLGESWIDGWAGVNAGYPQMSVMHDGREVIVYHRSSGNPCWNSALTAGDPGYVCTGYFTNLYDLPDAHEFAISPEPWGYWPKCCIVYDANKDTDYVHVVTTEIGPTGYTGERTIAYQRCAFQGDDLVCRSPGYDPYVRVPNTPYPPSLGQIAVIDTITTFSAVAVSSPVSMKVAFVYTKPREPNVQVNNDVFYVESTNNGEDWLDWGQWPPIKHNITRYPTTAVERAYTDVAACYDYSDSLHIVWIGCYYDSTTGEITNDAILYHWSETAITSIIALGYWDDGTVNPGAWNRNICKMSVSAKDPVYHPDDPPFLFCTWTQFNRGDNAQNGFTNGDIYASVSNDGGRTWSRGFNLTNTHTPHCAPGACLSEHWSSLAENMYDGNLHIEYVCDRDPGAAVQGEGVWTNNEMMYLHVEQLPSSPTCAIYSSLLNPPSLTTPPLKVPSDPGIRVITFRVGALYNLEADYEVISNHPRVAITGNPSGSLLPGQSVEVEATITCLTEEFIDATITVTGCIGTEYQHTIEIPLYAVCSDDYYECDRDPATVIGENNGTLWLRACANTEQAVWDKRIDPEEKQQVIFSGSVIAATSHEGNAVVGRQDRRDVFTGARDTINVVKGYDYFEPECNIQKIHVRNTYVWTPPPIAGQHPEWWWIDIHEQIILFYDRPGYSCPDWKKEQIIKYVWIDWSPPPSWWPDSVAYVGHEDIYLGVFADIDAPFDDGCQGCNTAGYDYGPEILWHHGWYNDTLPDGHPQYEEHYLGLALTDRAGVVVSPRGCQSVLNEDYLRPQGGWGWNSGELYQLAATEGVNIHWPDSVADRTVVLTAAAVPAGNHPGALDAEFILIEASTQNGLWDLQTHIDDTRNILIPRLDQLGLFSRAFPVCGDCTLDGKVLVNDAVFILGYLFGGGPPPPWPLTRGDPTGDGLVLINDAVYIITYLFGGGPRPVNCRGWGR